MREATSLSSTDVTYEWDSLNRLQSVIEAAHSGAPIQTTYSYDDVGNLESVTRPSVSSRYSYDAMNRLRTLEIRRGVDPGSTLKARFNYHTQARPIGPNGNRHIAEEQIYGPITIDRTVHYDYDQVGRLKNEVINQTDSIVYDSADGYTDAGYDKVGNRRSRTVSAGLQSKVSEYANRAFNEKDQLGIETYDDNGNTLTSGEITPAPTANDLYDIENRLIQRRAVLGGVAATITLDYDGDGNRVRKVVVFDNAPNSPVGTYYLVDDRNPTGYAQVIEEWQSLGSAAKVKTRAYVYGHDLLRQGSFDNGESEPETVHYFGYDGHGATRFLMDGSGDITHTYTYDAFGIRLSDAYIPEPTLYLYAGEQWDPDLGLYYNRARYLNPNAGRFWTMDTYEGNHSDPLSLHKYLYAHNNPVNGVDPSGHEFSLVGALVTTANIGRTAAQVGFAVAQAYNRASAAYDAIQDVALVAGILGDGNVDDEEAEILAELVTDFVKTRVQGYAIQVVAGVGGKALGSVAGQLGRLKISQAAIRQTREWYRKHKADWAGRSRMTAAGSVNYDQHGWPDFSPYLRQGGVNTVHIKLTGTRSGDFGLADKAAGIDEAWRQANGYVWHHHQKLGTMQLVKKAAHTVSDGGAPHAGGVALFKRLYGSGYE